MIFYFGKYELIAFCISASCCPPQPHQMISPVSDFLIIEAINCFVSSDNCPIVIFAHICNSHFWFHFHKVALTNVESALLKSATSPVNIASVFAPAPVFLHSRSDTTRTLLFF